MILAPGTRINANVCLVQPLGEGGMGSVWLADHQTLHTRVAVKFIAAELVKSEPTVLERFKREAALCAQIKSPHVVQTFDHGVMEDGRPYIVMELLEGESLQHRLDRERTLSFRDAKAVVTQTCKALGKAHRLGIVHRDIKPDNLYLTPDEDEPFLLKVLDFGIAKQTGLPQTSKMTSTGAMVGTPEYMSPEQVLSGNTIDYRSDLWAVAVVAYHALTGAVPFVGETLGSLCVAIAAGRYRPPSHYRSDLLPSVDRWFERALSVEPAGRHASARELAQSFGVALTPHETVDDFATNEGFSALVGSGAVAPVPNSSARATGPTFLAPALSGISPPPSALSTAGGTGSRTLALVAVGSLSLAAAIAYFFLSGPPPYQGAAGREPEPTPSAVAAGPSAAPDAAAITVARPTATAATSDEAPSATASAAPPGPATAIPTVGPAPPPPPPSSDVLIHAPGGEGPRGARPAPSAGRYGF